MGKPQTLNGRVNEFCYKKGRDIIKNRKISIIGIKQSKILHLVSKALGTLSRGLFLFSVVYSTNSK
jgi:hypothetical protein